jgi:glycerol-3-phosphate dehydrogenase
LNVGSVTTRPELTHTIDIATQPVRPSPPVANNRRAATFRAVDGADYDVAILGAGISGARIFHELARRGYRVLLLDKGDFASGTSQASGMMIWGGLLYLKDLDLLTVAKLCRARDELIGQLPDRVRVESLRYLPGTVTLRNRHLVRAGMVLYWLLGSRQRRWPAREAEFSERGLLKAGRFRDSLTVEEAVLNGSDCRFALEWILGACGPDATAVNHCSTEMARFDPSIGAWRLELQDRLHCHQATATARHLVNAAGIWTDRVNEQLGIGSPYRHELSKGVYITFRRPEPLQRILVFDSGQNNDTTTFVPWGPVAMFGPTETRVTELAAGLTIAPEDVRSLLALANQNLRATYRAEDIVSMRCGVRPLAVSRDFSKVVYPLELSRKHRVFHDAARRVVAVYGGKLTSCGLLAEEVLARLAPHLPQRQGVTARPAVEPPPVVAFPGLAEPVPAAAWCRDHEYCHTLDDYLRRRTNIAQWLPRGGLGANSENLTSLQQIAGEFYGDTAAAEQALADYQTTVRDHHDAILAAV